MKPLSPRLSAGGYLATVLAGLTLFRIEPFGYSLMGLFGIAAATKPLFSALASNERVVGVLYFVVLLLSILLVTLYGWLGLSAGLLALKDVLAPSFLPGLSRATPYVVLAAAVLMLIGLASIAIFPGEQPQKLYVNVLWFLIPVTLLALSGYVLVSKRRKCA